MRRATDQKFWLGFLAVGLVFSLTGCEEPLNMGMFDRNPTEPGVAGAPGSTGGDSADDPVDELTAQAQAQAQRVSGNTQATQTGPPREVLWLNVTGEGYKTDPATTTTSAKTAPQAQPIPTTPADHALAVGVTPAMHPSDTTAEHAGQPDTSSTAPLSKNKLTQTQVYEQLLKTVREGDDSNLSKALVAATLGVIDPHGEMDWTMLASLSPKDKDLVERYHKTVSALRREVQLGGGKIDQNELAGRLEEVFGQQPVAIRNIQLCQKVLGYGVYDAFPDNTFVAGREQTLIVYVEVDHFKPVAREQGDGYEVRLKQELELYGSDGYMVWSHEPVVIPDFSRNKRRDFFIVQLVTLPSQLGLGKYHLKVRVYDENAGTRDESSIQIRLVADKSLVRGSD